MKAFTLIELLFVIIIVIILSVGAINSIPDNTLMNNTNYIYNKILEKKANALGFMANMQNEEENSSVCITFNKDWLKNDENKSNVKFNISNRVSLSTNTPTICFDYLGRPYNGSVDLINFNNILHKPTDITISYKNESNIITIYPITGDVEIR